MDGRTEEFPTCCYSSGVNAEAAAPRLVAGPPRGLQPTAQRLMKRKRC